MARTAIEGGCLVADGTSAIDTADYGRVSVLYVAGTTAGTLSVTVCDTADGTFAAPEDGELIDPSTGAAPTLTGLKSTFGVVSYIGSARYVKASISAGTAVVLCSEPRQTN